MNTAISVVIPVYNGEKYLCHCLGSLINQTLRDFEMIFVDDGSTDGSLRILRDYARQDSRIRIITQPNAGAGIARNTGMDAAGGEYILFLDADDWFEPDYLEAALEKIQAEQADICICKAVMFDNSTGKELPSDWMLRTELVPRGVFSPESISEYLFQFTFGQVWDKLYRREFLSEAGFRFPSLKAAEDTAFTFKTILAAKRITVLPKVGVHYRVNRSDSVSKSFTKNASSPFDAFEMLYDYLAGSGLMRQYERSFLNWAMQYLVWQASNIGDPGVQKHYLHLLKESWFPRLGFENHPIGYYYSKTDYCKYILAKRAPAGVFALVVSLYKRLKSSR